MASRATPARRRLYLLNLDIRTLIQLLVWGNLASTLLLLSYRPQGDGRHAYRAFISGKLLLAVAWYLLGQRGVISDLLSVYAGNGLIIAGFACETVALISLFDRRREWTALPVSLALAGFVVFASFAHEVPKRVPVSSVVTVAQYVPALFVMLRAPLTSPLRKGTAALYGAFVIVVGVRAWFGFAWPATLMSPGVIQSASFLSLIFLMFVGTTAFVLLLKEHDDRQLAASEQEQRILRGLLPICAHCKKIRDDKGYWNQLERYITAHSAAQFSHGICPECALKLYPDLAGNVLDAVAATAARDPQPRADDSKGGW